MIKYFSAIGLMFMATLTFAQLNLTIQYLDAEQGGTVGIANEPIQLINQRTNEVHEEVTDAEGNAIFVLPIGDSYDIQLTYEEPNQFIATKDMPANSRAALRLMGYGSAYYEALEEEERLAEEEWQKEEDERAKQAAEDAKKDGSMYFCLSSPESKSVGGISVYDGGKEGTLLGQTGYFYTTLPECGRVVTDEQATISVTKAPGTYTFYAVSGDGTLEWNGEYTIVGNTNKNFILTLE